MRDRILPESARDSFLKFVQAATRGRHAGDAPPRSRAEWLDRRAEIRVRLAQAFGEFPAQRVDLEPQILGTIERDGYRIERLIFQSRPGIWVTANAYVPAGDGRRATVLSVHGHWAWARVDPTPQARDLGLVRHGYFVLAVDAFGAGERAIDPAAGTYHGATLGASTWPAGVPLAGLQVYDNMRAVDYLLTRPEVDGEKLAITGASGGGNQSMYAGAWDERFKAVVPVCSVGTFDAYLGAACCVCEVVPGALTFCEEGDILALVAPRALMVINATRDGHQFSVGEAEKSLARARPMFELLEAGDRLKHVVVDSGHDYNRPMREAMYGWLARWLRGDGDGSPVPEREFKIEEIDTLRCFPDNKRPESFTLMPAFVHEQARRKVAKFLRPDHVERWEADASMMKTRLEQRTFGGFPRRAEWTVEPGKQSENGGFVERPFVLFPEPAMPVPGVLVRGKGREGPRPTALVVDPAGKDVALSSRRVNSLVGSGWQVAAFDVRATGETALARETVRDAVDHNSAEWSIWMGRPLVGQWCWDVIRTIDYLITRDDVDRGQFAIIGVGAGSVAAICTAALDERVQSVAAYGLLSSFASRDGFAGHRMATFVPFLLDVGDVPHLAALIAPRRLIIAGPVNGQSKPLDAEAAAAAFEFTEYTYHWYRATGRLHVAPSFPDELLAVSLRGV